MSREDTGLEGLLGELEAKGAFRTVEAWNLEGNVPRITALGNWLVHRTPDGAMLIWFKKELVGVGSIEEVSWKPGLNLGVLNYGKNIALGKVAGMRAVDSLDITPDWNTTLEEF